MRCAGFDKVDLDAAKEFGLQWFAFLLLFTRIGSRTMVGMHDVLNRKLHKVLPPARDANFLLRVCRVLTSTWKTVGVIGSWQIGLATMRILKRA